jgi:hypothetical protein
LGDFAAAGCVAGLLHAGLLAILAPPSISIWPAGRFLGHALEEILRFSLAYGALRLSLAADARHERRLSRPDAFLRQGG